MTTNARPSTLEIVSRARRFGTDYAEVEIKSGSGGLPKSTVETLSAFANGRGGTLLLGLSENDHFTPVRSFDARKISDALADTCANKVTPPIRDTIDIVEVRDCLAS